MSRVETPSNQNRYIDPTQQRVHRWMSSDDKFYLSRALNSYLTSIGEDIVLSGFETINSIITSGKDIQSQILPGYAIQDTTLLQIEDIITVQFPDAYARVDTGKFVVSINYSYKEVPSDNTLKIEIDYISDSGVPANDFSTDTHRIILDIISMTVSGGNIIALDNSHSSITILGKTYYKRGQTSSNIHITSLMEYMNYPSFANIVFVDPNKEEFEGQRYKTIQKAIDWVQSNGSPSIANTWGIKVTKSTSDDFDLVDDIFIIGEHPGVELSGTITRDSGIVGYERYWITNCEITGTLNIASGFNVSLNNVEISGTVTGTGTLRHFGGRLRSGTDVSGVYYIGYGVKADSTTFGQILMERSHLSSCTLGNTTSTTSLRLCRISDPVIDVNTGLIQIDDCACSGFPTLEGVRDFKIRGGTFNDEILVINDAVNVTRLYTSGVSAVTVDNQTPGTTLWFNEGEIYDNSTSGLTATNSQSAIDELHTNNVALTKGGGLAPVFIPDGIPSPDLSVGRVFITGNTAPTSFVDFINGVSGDIKIILIQDSLTTIVPGPTIYLSGGVPFAAPLNSTITFCFDGAIWHELSRSSN